MKVSLIFFFVFILGAKAQTYQFKLYSCETTSLIILDNNKFHFENELIEPVVFDTIVNSNDLNRLKGEFQKLLENPNDEVWLNSCVDDGYNLKFILTDGKIKKKVFVGNYFQPTLNQIAIILKPYMTEMNKKFHFSIGYGIENEEEIKKEIRLQQDCNELATDENKMSLLNNWCEPYK